MSCQRIVEVDLVAFLARPDDPAWDDFRAHYPECGDCAREMHAWSDLHASLLFVGPAESNHPSKGALLRFERHPERLPSAEHAAIREHLATCRSCPDELAALRGFDFSIFEPTVHPVADPQWSLSSMLATWLAPVGARPALAVAALLVLIPAIFYYGGRGESQRMVEVRDTERPPETARALAARPEVAQEERPARAESAEAPTRVARAVPPRIDEGSKPKAVTGNGTLTAAEPTADRAPQRLLARARSESERRPPPPPDVPAAIVDRTDVVKAPQPQPVDPVEPSAATRLAMEDRTPDQEALPDVPEVAAEPLNPFRRFFKRLDPRRREPRVVALRKKSEPRTSSASGRATESDNSTPLVEKRASDTWPLVRLASDHRVAIEALAPDAGLRLRIPSTDSDVRIDLIDPNGRRSSHEPYRQAGAPADVEVRIAAAALTSGAYRVALRRGEGDRAQLIGTFEFIVP